MNANMLAILAECQNEAERTGMALTSITTTLTHMAELLAGGSRVDELGGVSTTPPAMGKSSHTQLLGASAHKVKKPMPSKTSPASMSGNGERRSTNAYGSRSAGVSASAPGSSAPQCAQCSRYRCVKRRHLGQMTSPNT